MKKIVIGLILVLVTCSCEKYPQGGMHFSAGFLLNKNMTKSSFMDLKKYEVNGIDSTAFIVSNGDPKELKNYLRFFKYERDNYYEVKSRGAKELDISNNEYLQVYTDKVNWLDLPNGVKLRNVFTLASGPITWRIIKYKHKEMVLSAEKGGFHYRLTLVE